MYPPHSAIPDLKLSLEPSQASVPSPTAQSSDGASSRSDGMLHPKSGLRQPHPSTPSPYACSSRSKTILDTGSVSDSGITSRTNRLPRHLDVSLAHKACLSPLNMRHPSSSSPSLSLSGYLSDGCIFERPPSSPHPSRLDVKRLLSKPAALSVVSTVSISSDPESDVPLRSALNPSDAWPSRARVQASPRLVIDSPSISRSESSQPEQSPTLPPPSPQRPRNVLRKKSSSPQTHAVLSATLPSDISISSPSQSSTNPPAAVPSRSQRLTGLQSLIRSRAATPASAPPSGSGRLTPAGAIIQAYKEQDNRREALAAAANVEKRSPIIPTSSWLDPSTSERIPVLAAEDAPRSSDSFIMVDDPRELFSRTGERSSCDPSSSPHSSSNASQPIKSLTRKVSLRFRRGLAAVSGTGAQSARGHDDGEVVQRVKRLRSNTDVRDRPELQLSLDPHKANRKPEPLTLSVDTPPPSSGLIDSLDERSSHTTRGESALNSPYTFTQSKGKEKVPDTSTGTRLWRLVKRISTGALRERFQNTSEAPPPVPAIPRELPPLPPCATFEVQVPSESTGGDGRVDSSDGGDGGKGVMNYGIDSNPSASGLSSRSDGHSSTVAYMSSGSLQSHRVGEHPRRPSLSSSPQSSEPTSTRFFRSHSSRSSFSSIIANSPPRESFPILANARSSSPRARPRTKQCSTSSTRRTSHDESQRPSSVHTRARGRSIPDIPTFFVSGVVNNFILRRPSLTRHQRHHAPTRSMIFPRTSGDVSAAPLRRAGSEVRRTTRQRVHVDPILAPGSSGQNRDSQGSDTTVRQPPMSIATASAGASTNTGSSTAERFTFRELGSERNGAWTSQEKEDKWHALLEKSARAGGTLHLGVGSGQLASDNIRFSSSTYSSEMLV
jgi:hypothetical protein